MGLLDRLREFLSFGGAKPGDENAMVQVANVRAFQGPILEQVLTGNGIACSLIEEYGPVTREPMARIMVGRTDADRAAVLLTEFQDR